MKHSKAAASQAHGLILHLKPPVYIPIPAHKCLLQLLIKVWFLPIWENISTVLIFHALSTILEFGLLYKGYGCLLRLVWFSFCNSLSIQFFRTIH